MSRCQTSKDDLLWVCSQLGISVRNDREFTVPEIRSLLASSFRQLHSDLAVVAQVDLHGSDTYANQKRLGAFHRLAKKKAEIQKSAELRRQSPT